MSNSLKNVISRLQSDWAFVGAFLDNPEIALKDSGLTKNELDVILSKDIRALEMLGCGSQSALGAMSGAHSSQCHFTG